MAAATVAKPSARERPLAAGELFCAEGVHPGRWA
jgi:hypothetical protein